MRRQEEQAAGRWIFGLLCFASLVAAFVFAPDTLPPFKQRMLAIAAALLAGLLAYFMAGRFRLELSFGRVHLGEGQIKATSGLAIFIVVLLWWLGPFSPLDGMLAQFVKQEMLERQSRIRPCSDQYVTVTVPSLFRGPFYNPDGYDMTFELTNNQDRPLLVSEIRAYFISRKVFDQVRVFRDIADGKDFIYYVSMLDKPGVLNGHEHKVLPLRGPRFVPEELQMLVLHSGLGRVSECKFQVSREEDIEPMSPRGLALADTQETGIDGLEAVRKARALLKKGWSDAKLVSCLPGEYKTIITGNGLYVYQVTEWIVYYSTAAGQGVVIVGESDVKHAGVSEEPDARAIARRIDMDRVRIGSIEALRKAADLNLIRGNSDHGLALLVGRDESGRQLPIWRLPYIGPDYLNILVDAENGAVLASKEFWRDLCPMETQSRSRLEARKTPEEGRS